MWVLINGLCKPSLETPGHVTKITKRPKMDRKGTILNRYIWVITEIDRKGFVIFEYTINRLSFGYFHLPQLEYYFSSFFFFLLFLRLSTFTPLNALYSKFERLKISRFLCNRNRGCHVAGIPLDRVLQNFELLSC